MAYGVFSEVEMVVGVACTRIWWLFWIVPRNMGG